MCKPSKDLTLDKAIYNWPDKNIELPMPVTQASKVKPWLLWIIIPYAKEIGICLGKISMFVNNTNFAITCSLSNSSV